MSKPRVYLNEELQKRLPTVAVADDFDTALWRIERSFFFEKYGSLPYLARQTYFDGLAPIVNVAVEDFLKSHNYKVTGLHSIPVRGEQAFVSGGWISESDRDGFSIFIVDTAPNQMLYTVMGRDEESSERILNDLRSRVDKQFKGKVVRMDEFPAIIPTKEINKYMSWEKLRPSVAPKIADRMDKVLLPFFSKIHIFEKAGIAPRLGLLLHGEPGTGKTFLVKTIIREFRSKATVVHMSADQFVGRGSGSLRQAFNFLERFAPLVVVMEDIEALARDRAMTDSPYVQALLEIMDGAAKPLDRVVIIATTNMAEQIDPAFKRPGRFDEIWKIELPSPSASGEALREYFRKAGITIPQERAYALASAKLSYAQLRFAATELIRRAILNGESTVMVTGEELRELCGMARGHNIVRRAGFAREGREALDELLEED